MECSVGSLRIYTYGEFDSLNLEKTPKTLLHPNPHPHPRSEPKFLHLLPTIPIDRALFLTWKSEEGNDEIREGRRVLIISTKDGSWTNGWEGPSNFSERGSCWVQTAILMIVNWCR